MTRIIRVELCDECPHALTAEVREVRGGTRDICKVVSAPKGDEYAAD